MVPPLPNRHNLRDAMPNGVTPDKGRHPIGTGLRHIEPTTPFIVKGQIWAHPLHLNDVVVRHMACHSLPDDLNDLIIVAPLTCAASHCFKTKAATGT